MQVIIISDTHGYLHPEIRKLVNQSDLVVHAGDIGDAAVIDSLFPASGDVIAVRGNNDLPFLWPANQANRLSDTPLKNQVQVPGGIISVEHGDKYGYSPNHRAMRSEHSGARLVVYGHTHRLVIDDDETPWVVNPGAAGNSRTYGGSSCLSLKATDTTWELQAHKFPD